ncbi:MAG: alkylmercury lyase MerB [Anaerolineae bacterium]|nr:alkylmercury lyase MerB [Anaerolineae bacterium]
MELTELIDILTARKTVFTGEAAVLSRQILQLLAEGQPVTPERLAAVSGQPVEFIRTTFAALQKCGCEFNEQGALIGDALTLTPTWHHFRVKNRDLYAWCALDTLFLPALINQTAEITSTCPQTGAVIHLTVSPDGIEAVSPPETALSIVFTSGCTSGINGSFCGQIHYFVSREAAVQWVGRRTDFAVLSAMEAFELARQVYVAPLLKYD